MPPASTRFYQDTVKLIRLYNTSDAFKNSFNRGIFSRRKPTYLGRPLRLYVWLISRIDQQYKKYYSQLPINQENIEILFHDFWENGLSFHKLERATFNPTTIISPTDHQQIEQTDAQPASQNRLSLFEKLLESFDRRDTAERKEQKDRSYEGGPQLPSGLQETLKNIAQERQTILQNASSQGQIALRKGSLKAAQGVGNIAKEVAGGLLRGGGGAASKLGGLALQGAGRGLVAAGAAAAGVGASPLIIAFVAVVVFIMVGPLLFNLLSTSALCPPYLASCTPAAEAVSPTFVGGGSCPDTSTNTSNSCRYLNPAIDLFNIKISQADIDSYISKYSPTFISGGKGSLDEFKKRVDYIISNSQKVGLNPAIFLGYWKSESNFSTFGNRDMGCAGDSFYEQVDCALGIGAYSDPAKNPVANCAKSGEASSIACRALKSIRTGAGLDQTHPIKYPIVSFDDFVEAYGPYDHLVNGQPTNCTHTYNTLIKVAKDLNMCKTATYTPSGSGLISCPVNSPRITAGSINTPGGHCTPSYQLESRCVSGDPTGKSQAIDVQSSSGDNRLFLPFIAGQGVNWTVNSSTNIRDGGIGVGEDLVASTKYGGHSYILRLVHLDKTTINVQPGETKNSGTYLGNYRSAQNHIHITLQEDGNFQPADLYFKLCQ